MEQLHEDGTLAGFTEAGEQEVLAAG